MTATEISEKGGKEMSGLEDNVEGKISDERFAKMSENYESEQKSLKRRTIELRSSIAIQKENCINVNSFVALVRKHTDIQELNA